MPETPVWLLAQGRTKDAMKSLQYLRGWTTEENVKEEFDKLVIYSKNLHRCVLCCIDDESYNMKVEETNQCKHMQFNPFVRYAHKNGT